MKNVNINLTSEQAKLVDKKSHDYGFANRSEFIRAVLRYVLLRSPQILNQLDTAIFEEPPTRDPEYIKSELEKSGKYSKAFILSMARGLKKSEYFNK